MQIIWLGHSCFKIESQGYQIIIDPYQKDSVPGYAPIMEQADQVLCSHEHRDHSGKETVSLRQRKNSPFTVKTIKTWHDNQQGSLRGNNIIHIISDGQFAIAHLGDLGCALTQEQVEMLKGLDALLIPVGGYYTIDAMQARMVMKQLQPHVTIPMHYRGEHFGYDVLGPVEDFLKEGDCIVRYESSIMELEENFGSHIAILKPQNKLL